ncbi:MAG: hypothetical protein FJ090_16425 [Deltaproteobacteria bacterium]|nr:hypothetical protein [Deltaproteobacteria bacterium]
MRVVFSTCHRDRAATVNSSNGHRWNMEVTFRELKQELGCPDSSARKPAAVLRTAAFVGLVHTAFVLWFLDKRSGKAQVPARPWYPKQGLGFADILRAAQLSLQPLDILAVSRGFPDRGEIRPSVQPESRRR